MVAEVLRERSCALRGRSASGTPKVVIEHIQDAFTGEITFLGRVVLTVVRAAVSGKNPSTAARILAVRACRCAFKLLLPNAQAIIYL